MENSEIEDGVYLSDLAEYMHMSITDISKAVKKLQQKGYVEWHTDDKKKEHISLLQLRQFLRCMVRKKV